MPGASRPDAHFRVEFDDAAFAEDLEHTASGTGRTLGALSVYQIAHQRIHG